MYHRGMSKTHVERHFSGGATVRDVVIGMSDGLTVPFALAAGLSGAVASSHIVVTAGLAEVAAGAIAMGLGGFLAARGDAEHYAAEQAREFREVKQVPQLEEDEVRAIFVDLGLTDEESQPVVDALKRSPDKWVAFMMRFELGLEAPEPKRALWSALTIGGSYVVGSALPLLPYFFVSEARRGLVFSAVLTAAALLVFGAVKAHFTDIPAWRGAAQTLLIGGLAAVAAFALARAFA
jgi:VIT1/CCC1 family predicted Fe2+/Mn2+ transporter